MSVLRFAVAALAAVSLTGCATFDPTKLDPADTAARLEARTLAEPGFRRFLVEHGQGDSDAWDLNRLTLAAYYFSPTLDVARAQLAAAEAAVQTAGARPNPTIQAGPGYNKDFVPVIDGSSPWINLYSVYLPIETAGKRGYRLSEARHRADAARFQLAGAAWSARSAVRRALIDLHAAEESARLWRSQQPLFEEAARLAAAQARAGEISPFEQARLRVTLDRAELALRESERGAIDARSRLAEAVGVPLPIIVGAKISYDGLDTATAPALPNARRWAAQNRADLLSALADFEASQAALQLEIAGKYPDVTLGPGLLFDQGQDKWSLLLSAALPVLNQNQGPIATARARREEAAARFVEIQNRVLAEVDRAFSDYTSALGDLQTLRGMRTALQTQTGTIQAQWKAGEITQVELTQAELALADNAHAELDARARAEAALGAIEDAVQRPLNWPDDAWRKPSRPAIE